jgi:low affinity Fe/Cu permease
MSFNRFFSNFASQTAKTTGSPWAFVLCLTVVAVWAGSGPLFNFSDTWQLVINTGTTIITFLMVFLIQNTQNRDALAIQAKLDELILTSDAENRYIGIEKLTDKELRLLQERCVKAVEAHERVAAKAEAEMSARERKARSAGERPRAATARKPRKRPAPGRRASA